MDYVRPEFEREDVNRAGALIRQMLEDKEAVHDGLENAIRVVDNFRGAHYFPMNTLYMTLKNRALRISPAAVPSMRLKQFGSIARKLHDKSQMKLTQMQDIGGCRVVLPTIGDVDYLREQYLVSDKIIHQLAGKTFEKDYISEPKASGYRSIHLKYKFHATAKSAAYEGLRVEMQFRTQLQHRWAVAVEAAGTFTKADLKSGRGDPNWLRFFSLMGSVYALWEGMAPVPGTPDNIDDLASEITALNEAHYIERTFSEMRTLLPRIRQQRKSRLFVIALDPRTRELEVEGFQEGQSVAANAYLTEMEQKHGVPESPVQVVLVTVSKVSDLERAYPSYFLDTEEFLWDVREMLRD